MRRISPYVIMSTISIVIRQFVLPNPFECFGASQSIVINWIVEPIMHILVLAIVGLFYRRGSFPAWGSFLYLLMYSIITGILHIMGIFAFAWWWIIIVIVAIVALTVGIVWLRRKSL